MPVWCRNQVRRRRRQWRARCLRRNPARQEVDHATFSGALRDAGVAAGIYGDMQALIDTAEAVDGLTRQFQTLDAGEVDSSEVHAVETLPAATLLRERPS